MVYKFPHYSEIFYMRFDLTNRQREVLEYIAKFMAKAGYSPTVREIGSHFNFAPGSVTDHLRALERKGYLRRDPAKSRTLQILAVAHAHKPVLTSGKRPKKYASGMTRKRGDSKRRHTCTPEGIPSSNGFGSVIQDQLGLYSGKPGRENASAPSGEGNRKSTRTMESLRYQPLASTWEGEDAELLERMLGFYPRKEPRRILDATINGGRFWRGSKRSIIGMDIEAAHTPNLVGDNACMPVRNHAFDVVVYDPPHIPNQGRDKSKDFNIRFGLVLRSAKETGYTFSHTYPPFLREAYRVLKPEGILFCKISDYIHDHRYQWAHVDFIQAAREAGFFPCDCIIKVRKGPIIDPKWKIAHHSRRQHCYWLVFRKSDRCE